MKKPSATIADLLKSKIFFIVIFIIFVFLAISLSRHIKNYIFIRKEVRLYETKIAAEEEKNNTLSEKQRYMQSDFFREETARLKFGLQKEGEQSAIIKGRESIATTTSASAFQPSISNFKKWWSYFINAK
ncbi:MAG: septum formation initiator family protein [Parcubacteria group bacterium]|nr:septum formation initiator family protein [Parcubacteria group bacterium]